jgi:hypothetical protein
MNYVNLTPHEVRLNDGREFPPSGRVARVSVKYEPDGPGMYRMVPGEIRGLPDPVPGTTFIVSNVVMQAARRPAVVAPASGHREAVWWGTKVCSVPGFVHR